MSKDRANVDARHRPMWQAITKKGVSDRKPGDANDVGTLYYLHDGRYGREPGGDQRIPGKACASISR